MLFCVIGNIASGKSSILENNVPTSFVKIDIDTYRQKFNPWRLKNRERYVYDAVRFVIQNNRNVVFESSGASKRFDAICRLHQVCKIIKVECAPEVCLQRIAARKTDNAFPFDYRIQDSVWMIHAKLREINPDFFVQSDIQTLPEMRAQILSYFQQFI